MSALAIPRPDHSTSHSPADPSPPRTIYKPIAPSRDTAHSHPPPMPTPTPPRPAATTEQAPRSSPMDVDRQPGPSSSSSSKPQSEDARAGAESPNDAKSSHPPIPPPPTIVEIKAEGPPSPSPARVIAAPARRRPQKLDLNTNTAMAPGRPSAPLTAKESGGLSAMHDVATACLSPGFDTTDPKMRSQMERSRDLAEQQRQIIAARQNRGVRERDVSTNKAPADFGPPPSSFSKPLGTSRRKAPPSMLSLNAAAAGHYSEPRVIQSAPINQTFTGLHRPMHPLSRQVLEHSHSHQHSHLQTPIQSSAGQYSRPEPRNDAASPYSAAPQSGRLPPIADLVRPDTSMHNSPHGPPSQNSEFRPPIRRATSGQERTNGHDAAYLQSLSSPHDGRFPMHRTGERGPERETMYAPHVSQPVSSPLTSAHPSNGAAPAFYSRPEDRSPKSASEERRLAERTRSRDQDMLYPPRAHNSGSSPGGSSHPYKPSPVQPSAFPPGYNPTVSGPPPSARRPEFEHRPGEEIAQSIEGREEGQPKPLPYGTYGGRQPPTPNSPLPPMHAAKNEVTQAGRRRGREEFERDHEAVDADEREREHRRRQAEAGLGFGFGTWINTSGTRHSPETMRRKREEFLSLCTRAWDLLHE